MIKKVFNSIHESVKKRNTPDNFIIDGPSDVNVIHRGYIKNSFYPLKYDFVPRDEGKSKNEGEHVYSFSKEKTKGVVSINHRVNKNIESGHETTSTVSFQLDDIESGIDIARTLIPAIVHHIKSHDPDIIKIEKGFKFSKKLMSRIDPKKDKFDIKKTKTGIVIKKKQPIDEKSKRIISHIQKKLNNNNTKE